MRIVYHLGVHCTDEDRLVRCLLKNRAVLAEQGIVVPPPTRYRNLLRDTVNQLRGAAASEETEAMILDQIMDEGAGDRLILSWSSFLSFPAYAVGAPAQIITCMFPPSAKLSCPQLAGPAGPRKQTPLGPATGVPIRP